MKRYYKCGVGISGGSIMKGCAIAVIALMAGCTQGGAPHSFIPDGQQMELKIGDVAPFEMRIAENDSIPASGLGRMFLGSWQDDDFGWVEASAMTDFYPTYTNIDFGRDPVVDSVHLDITLMRIIGDATVEQTFNIYELTDSLKRDSVYLKGRIDLGSRVDGGKPLFSFKLSDKIPEGGNMLLKLTPTVDGEAFIRRLAGLSKETYSEPWPEFRKAFNGLYFAPTDPTLDAAVYDIDLRNYASGLVLWFRNADMAADSIHYASYDFRDTGWYLDNRVVNMNLNQVEYTHPFVVDEAVVTSSYVQGLGGVSTKLTATDELLAWFEAAKGDNSAMVINKARLLVPIEAGQNTKLMPPRMGMYYHIGTAKPIPDYNYSAENNIYSSVRLPYGGYRSATEYEMDITTWLTQLMLAPETTPREIWLAPEINTLASEYSQVTVLEPQLTVTYTLVR